MAKFSVFLAFLISAAAFGYGAYHLFRKETPKYFQMFVCAAGCYMLEELWVIVNLFFGNALADGLVTVRLLGCFGCLCFILSANGNRFDRIVDEGTDKKAGWLALIAPAVLLTVFAAYAFSAANDNTAPATVLGFLSISPALFAAWFSLKHLLLPGDPMGYLRSIRGIDILSLVFFAANYLYTPLNYYFPAAMRVFDLILGGMLFGLMVLCRRGAVKWKTLI